MPLWHPPGCPRAPASCGFEVNGVSISGQHSAVRDVSTHAHLGAEPSARAMRPSQEPRGSSRRWDEGRGPWAVPRADGEKPGPRKRALWRAGDEAGKLRKRIAETLSTGAPRNGSTSGVFESSGRWTVASGAWRKPRGTVRRTKPRGKVRLGESERQREVSWQFRRRPTRSGRFCQKEKKKENLCD